MWSMLMATFVLHALVMPCVLGCMIIPVLYFSNAVHEGGPEGVLANTSIFYGSFVTALLVMVLVFSA